jgi:hypothetical protein
MGEADESSPLLLYAVFTVLYTTLLWIWRRHTHWYREYTKSLPITGTILALLVTNCMEQFSNVARYITFDFDGTRDL